MRHLALTVAVLAALVAGVLAATSEDPPRRTAGQAEYVWGQTPRDWVSWADEIAVVEVIGEERLPFEVPPGEEGYVGRTVDARVGARLWRHADARRTPSSVKLRTADGWWYDHGDFIPSGNIGEHRAEVGDLLVVAIIDSPTYGPAMMGGGLPLDPGSRVRVDDGQTDIGARVDGLTLAELGRVFRRARPFPAVERFRHLDVTKRMIAVYEHRQRTGGRISG